MKIQDLYNIEKEEDRINALYSIFDEESRLSTKATRIEFLTTIRQVEKHLKPGMKCIYEVKRVCKDNGKMFFAFISNDMVITTETMCYNQEFLKGNQYNHNTFKVKDFPFVFHTVDDCRELLINSNLRIKSEIAADGLSELLADKINNMDDESYSKWINYHFYCSEKPEFLGVSNHLLFVAEK